MGESALFLRFAGCDLRCGWCDSPQTWPEATHCRVETRRGSAVLRTIPNPVALEDVMAAAEQLEVGAHRLASLTGGEPLLQPQAVRDLACALRERGVAVHLETRGLDSEALDAVVETIDVVAMDWKLASDVRRASDPRDGPIEDFHDAHERFLRVALRASERMVKVVLTPASREAELDALCVRIAATAPNTPVVLQPVTPFGSVSVALGPERILALAARVSRMLPDVRVIPQTHRLIGVP